MQTQSRPRDPISEGWFQRGTPLDHRGRVQRPCPVCGSETAQDEYVAILGHFTGVGAPFFVQPFVKRRSTAGKVGKRSNWFACAQCGSLFPGDDVALAVAASRGGDFFAHATPAVASEPAVDPAVLPSLEKAVQEGLASTLVELESKYGPRPWTLDVFDKGLRDELGEVLLRHARARATELLGPNQATAQGPPLAHLTGRIERLIRADAAIAAALRDAAAEISHRPNDGEYVASIAVGAVMKELGVPFQQAAELAQTVMKD
jgi:hypothetical protein